ncbi:MAG: hypothetical protein Kow0042_08240 [Calditrichia bacterium]
MGDLKKEESKKIRRLQLMVDLTIQLLYQTEALSMIEGMKYIQNAKNYAIKLFPDKGDTFDLIYKPRMMRVLRDRGLIVSSKN